jgi:RimJ/RimL family protein N-acetyltransferase
MQLFRLSAANETAALEYLSRDPYSNVFVSHVILCDFDVATRSKIFVASEEGVVCGVGYFGRQLALASDESALDAFADHARKNRGERMILGPRHTIGAFWQRIARWHTRPRAIRERQLVMMIDRTRLHPAMGRGVTVRHARLDEWTAVADASAQMILQELDYDPRRTSSDFTAGIRHMIERRLWWVGVSYGRLCFFCNVGPWCKRTAQLQGIWSPPELRGRGLATASLAAICGRLLDDTPTLSLYVNDFNEPAIALYRRVGFEHVGDFTTMLF